MGVLREKVEQYVKTQLQDYKPLHVRAPKVIHDSILGSNLFMPHEIAVLDLPLVQRLRRISQVAVASLVYPSGNHNRFEHTLGVAVLAGQLVKALFRKINEGKIRRQYPYTEVDVEEEFVFNHVRMAAIMHDCGHGPFSHVSEKVFKEFDDLLEETKNSPYFPGASAHEILSYLIVTSNSFKKYFKEEIADNYCIDIDLNLVGEMIIGYVSEPKKAFLVEIINGAFDADKLDYIQRDSHFTGIKMVLDLQRLFYTVDLVMTENKYLRLSVDLSGVSTLEQIIFNKMMLFNTVYHHHKVRAAECLFRSLIDHAKRKQLEIRGTYLESAADFLYLTDDDIYSLAGQKLGLVSRFASDLCYRRLPKRALVISRKTSDTNIEEFIELVRVGRHKSIMEKLIEAISLKTEELGNKVPVEEIWLDLQPGPNFKEAIECPIKSIGEELGYIRLHNVLPVDDWVKAFSQVKWCGYVFTKPENQEIVYEASKQVISDAFEITLNKYARILCKIEEDVHND